MSLDTDPVARSIRENLSWECLATAPGSRAFDFPQAGHCRSCDDALTLDAIMDRVQQLETALADARAHLVNATVEASHGLTASNQFIDRCATRSLAVIDAALATTNASAVVSGKGPA